MVPDKGAAGDFDYLWDKTDGSDAVDLVDHGALDHGVDEPDAYTSEADLDYLLAEEDSQHPDGFDAFDENTWGEAFTPVSATPWYRSRQARTLLVVSGVALSAIVVSVVLLAVRGTPTEDKPRPAATTTAVTTPLATATSEAPPPPPPPLPPPPPPQPAPVNDAPAVVRPTVAPRPTKSPELGVTRTPVTRHPISVAPQPRTAR